MGTISRLAFPIRLDLSFNLTCEKFLLSHEHIVKHLAFIVKDLFDEKPQEPNQIFMKVLKK
jgi:hypothetical protein